MGGVSSSLASKMAFSPPTPPSYIISQEEKSRRLLLDPRLRLNDVDVHAENVKILKLKTRHGNQIIAFYVTAKPMTKVTILYSHENAADLGTIYKHYINLSDRLNVNVIGYDYSGYGQSSGKPSEQNTYSDIEAVLKCLEENYGTKQEDIILYGQCIGSGPTLELAARLNNLRAIVLHSAFLSGMRLLYSVKHTFWFDIYKNIDKISLVKCIVLFIHGTSDEIIDFSHGRRLYNMCQCKYRPLWLSGGGHYNLEEHPKYFSHLEKFLNAVELSLRTSSFSFIDYSIGNSGELEKLGDSVEVKKGKRNIRRYKQSFNCFQPTRFKN